MLAANKIGVVREDGSLQYPEVDINGSPVTGHPAQIAYLNEREFLALPVRWSDETTLAALRAERERQLSSRRSRRSAPPPIVEEQEVADDGESAS